MLISLFCTVHVEKQDSSQYKVYCKQLKKINAVEVRMLMILLGMLKRQKTGAISIKCVWGKCNVLLSVDILNRHTSSK